MSNEEERSLISRMTSIGRSTKRNLIAYWLLGLCNNYAYVIMLCAAHDILSTDFNHNGTTPTPSYVNSTRDCNPISTGTILLADIAPGLAIKIFAPFILSYVRLRVWVVVFLSTASFIFVAFSTAQWMAFVGVVCAAMCGGLGEVTYLQYSARFHRHVVSAWSSGTGASGLLGSVSYAALTSAGMHPRNTLLVMLVIPVLMAASFFVILRHPPPRSFRSHSPLLSDDEDEDGEKFPSRKHRKDFRSRVKSVPDYFHYMLPLGLVYFFEYFINQGLFELLYFKNIWLDHHSQYRWFQVDYQIGVFISRSSVNLFTIRSIWFLAFLQFINMALLFCEALWLFIPSIWIVFGCVFFEGLVAGAAYVNTFYKIAHEVPVEDREFAMGVTSLANSVGISSAGGVAVPVHHALCQL